MPVYGINSLFGKLPLIGDILAMAAIAAFSA